MVPSVKTALSSYSQHQQEVSASPYTDVRAELMMISTFKNSQIFGFLGAFGSLTLGLSASSLRSISKVKSPVNTMLRMSMT